MATRKNIVTEENILDVAAAVHKAIYAKSRVSHDDNENYYGALDHFIELVGFRTFARTFYAVIGVKGREAAQEAYVKSLRTADNFTSGHLDMLLWNLVQLSISQGFWDIFDAAVFPAPAVQTPRRPRVTN
jgi:hypothetical protein